MVNLRSFYAYQVTSACVSATEVCVYVINEEGLVLLDSCCTCVLVCQDICSEDNPRFSKKLFSFRPSMPQQMLSSSAVQEKLIFSRSLYGCEASLASCWLNQVCCCCSRMLFSLFGALIIKFWRFSPIHYHTHSWLQSCLCTDTCWQGFYSLNCYWSNVLYSSKC